jgi:rhamnosyl/mannosyltransferase
VDRLGTELASLGHRVTYRSSRDAWRGSLGEFRATTLGWSLLRRRALDRVDVVVLHGPVPTMSEVVLLGLGLRSRARRPRLVYVHHFDVEIQFLGVLSLLYNLVNRRLAGCADHVVVTSPSYALAQRGRADGSVSVVPWGVDMTASVGRRMPYTGDRPLRVLFVGQQRPYKGVSNLIAAVAGSSKLQLTVVGSGPLEAEHRLLALRLGADNVEVRGRVDDSGLDSLFADHDVIALPSVSRLEAFGMVLLEGMQAGCVPVASDLPGVRDVVGDAGVLVPPRRVLTLRNELEALADSPADVLRCSDASIERARTFSWERTRDGYEAVLTQLSRPTD